MSEGPGVRSLARPCSRSLVCSYARAYVRSFSRSLARPVLPCGAMFSLVAPLEGPFKRPLLMAPQWGRPDFKNKQNLFFIARAPSRIMTNPRRWVGSFLENMNVEPHLEPITFQNSKIVIFDNYSLLGFLE